MVLNMKTPGGFACYFCGKVYAHKLMLCYALSKGILPSKFRLSSSACCSFGTCAVMDVPGWVIKDRYDIGLVGCCVGDD